MADIQSEDVKSIQHRKYNDDAKADRAIIRAQDSVSGNWVNIAATDNGDGTFSLKTSSTGDSSGIAAYSDSGGTDRKGLVDADRHVQTDIVGSLPAGTNNIGDVDVLSVIPGTGATNLGKAIDSVVGATDTGVATLLKKMSDVTQSAVAEGDWDVPTMTGWGEQRTRDQRAQDIDSCNATTGWSVLGNDTTGLAVSTNHVFGTGALTFNKVDGAANTVFAGIQKTLTSVSISEKFEDGGNVALGIYLPSLSNVVSVFLRLGTDASNYNEWEWPVDDLTASTWLALRSPTNSPTNASVGNGWTTSAITYVAVGVEFNSQSNTLSGIVVDNLHFVQARVTDASIDTTVNSSVNTPNVNIHRIAGTQTDSSTGNASAGTLRVVNATNDPNLSAIQTALDNRYGGGKTAVNFTVTASGDTTIHTPTPGMYIRLYSITAITDPDESTTPLIKVLIGSTEVRRGYAISGWEISDGIADDVLKINLSGASSVSGTAFIKEFVP